MIASAVALIIMSQSFRPPAFPLITHDPYLSIWSTTDHPADSWPTHWTGRPHAMACLARIDGEPYRLMGLQPSAIQKMQLLESVVTPTATEYRFHSSGVEIKLRFLSPLLPHRMEVLSRPASYISWESRSTDGKPHAVEIYFDMTAEAAVDEVSQIVDLQMTKHKGLSIGAAKTKEQHILGKKGDDRRIDWGTLYVTAPVASTAGIAKAEESRNAFSKGHAHATTESHHGACNDDWPVISFTFDLGQVVTVEKRHLVVAYDDVESIQFLGVNLAGFWRTPENAGLELPVLANREFAQLSRDCADFDVRLMADLEQCGSKQYERIATLAYRTAIAGSKLVKDRKGSPMFFPKENTSNGCIATVDVIYPMLPLFLFLDIELAKASLRPVLEYAATDRWKFPFAPHDVGTYPIANGQVYGGGERTEENQMPVEESANMIIMLAAIAHVEGNASFAKQYWRQVEQWAEYLESKGYDPDNQLSTDDFAGHLAHNVNLSAKAIIALACYAKLASQLDDKSDSDKYSSMAKGFASKWVSEATEGDHTLLAFDKPGTWSIKYNLVWDDILGLGLFPQAVKSRELEWYRKVAKKYGPALDSRQDYTKLDWVIWAAALSDTKEGFNALVEPVYRMLNETNSRVPMTDWYMVDSGEFRQFMARPVVGAVFLPMLKDRDLWKKWATKK